MIVWGGHCISAARLNTGGDIIRAPIVGQLRAPLTRPKPDALTTSVWTGSEMIVWGGEGAPFVLLNTGGRYDPSTDSWTATSTTNAPEARVGHRGSVDVAAK